MASVEDASVVVSGISGRFPNAKNLEKLWITSKARKQVTSSENGQKLKKDVKFDGAFFGLCPSTNGPETSYFIQVLEVISEAILDSGTVPGAGDKNTGLFIASTVSFNDAVPNLAERVADIFQITGPSVARATRASTSSTSDASGSSELLVLQNAFEAMQSGQCDAAIVAAINVHPRTGDGGDALEGSNSKMDEYIAAIFMQKRDTALREYLGLLEATQAAPSETSSVNSCESDFVGFIKLILHVQYGTTSENRHTKNEDGTAEVLLGEMRLRLIIPPKDLVKNRMVSSNPVLIPFAGRTKEGVHESLQKVVSHQRSFQFESLLHKVSEGSSTGVLWPNPVRGYLIRGDLAVESSFKEVPAQKMKLWLIFSGTPGSLWPGMAEDLMELKVFAKSIKKSAEILKPFGIDLINILMCGDAQTLDRYLGTGYIAMGVAFIDTLRAVGVEPDGYIGHSGGELLCAYFDGCLSHEEALISYYWKDECVQTCLGGTMASVALSWEQARKKCPPWIYPACHNAKNNVTVAGLAKDVPTFLAELKAEGVLGIEVNSGGVAYHSRYLKPMLATFEAKLREVIPADTVMRTRSKKFVSTSIPEKEWAKRDKDDIVDYLVNNIKDPVLFYPVLKHIPRHAAVIEVTPNAQMITLLETVLGKTCSVWGLEKQDGGNNNAVQLLRGLGKLYENGFDLKISNLYPEPQFPVAIGTPMIAPLVTWNRSDN